MGLLGLAYTTYLLRRNTMSSTDHLGKLVLNKGKEPRKKGKKEKGSRSKRMELQKASEGFEDTGYEVC